MPENDSQLIQTNLGLRYRPVQPFQLRNPYTDLLKNTVPLSPYTDDAINLNEKLEVADRMFENEDPRTKSIYAHYNTGDIISGWDPQKYQQRMAKYFPEQYKNAQMYLDLDNRTKSLYEDGNYYRPAEEIEANEKYRNYLLKQAANWDATGEQVYFDQEQQRKRINDEIAAWTGENFSELSPEAQDEVAYRQATRLNTHNFIAGNSENITPDDVKRYHTFMENGGMEKASRVNPKSFPSLLTTMIGDETATDTFLQEKTRRLLDPEYQYLSKKFRPEFNSIEQELRGQAASQDGLTGSIGLQLATLPLWSTELTGLATLGKFGVGRALQGGLKTLMSHPHWLPRTAGRLLNTPLLTALQGSFGYSGVKELLNKNYGRAAVDLGMAFGGPFAKFGLEHAQPYTWKAVGTLKNLGKSLKVLSGKEPMIERWPTELLNLHPRQRALFGLTKTTSPLGTTVKIPYSTNAGVSALSVTQNSPLAQSLGKAIGYGVPLGTSAGLTYYGGKGMYDAIKEKDFDKGIQGAMELGFGLAGLGGMAPAFFPKKSIATDPIYPIPTLGEAKPLAPQYQIANN